MAEPHSANQQLAGTMLEAYLRQELPDDYAVVGQPLIRGVPLDAIVVGPQGLFVLHALDWEGHITPAAHGRWRERTPDGRVRRRDSPRPAAKRAGVALQRFVKGEFPRFKPAVHQYAVLLPPTATLATSGASSPPCVTLAQLVPMISAAATPPHGLLTVDERHELAQALAERHVTRDQRVQRPFIFRSGGWFGRGYQAHTVRQVVQHLDRYPNDGVYHLRNGTLEDWLVEQGALHLARLAHQAVRDNLRDARAALEVFMLGTGLVERPRLEARPRRVKLGYVLEGQTANAPLELRKGRGRGYLFGRVEPRDVWVQIIPTEIEGTLQGSVTVDTSMLTIKREPWRSAVCVISSASAKPIEIPVEVHVVSALPGFTRVVLRPLLGLLIGATLGAAIGLTMGGAALSPPAFLHRLAPPPLPQQLVWALICAITWGVVGLLRALTWEPLVPTGACVVRWLGRVLLWELLLAALALLSPWMARWLFPAASASVSAELEQTVKLTAVWLAIIPGTWGEFWDARAGHKPRTRQRRLRGFLRGAAVVISLATLLLLLRVGAPLWDRLEGAQHASTTRAWVEDRWQQLDAWVGQVWGRAYLRQMDRRAPTRQPAGLTPGAFAEPGAVVE